MKQEVHVRLSVSLKLPVVLRERERKIAIRVGVLGDFKHRHEVGFCAREFGGKLGQHTHGTTPNLENGPAEK